MKHLKTICICLLALVALMLAGCSTTRKAAQSSTEQHITSSKQEDRHTEHQTGEAVNTQQTIHDITNAVIEFTKVEFNDGTVTSDTTAHTNQDTSVKRRNREQTEPPNNGIKSITTGRVILNNDRTESNEADIKRESETKSDASISEDSTEDNAAEDKTEEKPKRGFFYYFGTITMAVISIVSLVFIVLGIKNICKNKKSQ